jgi:molybdopterin-guanine dinucleotide biosynthesis protein A
MVEEPVAAPDRQVATAVVLAGGRSRRFGSDKLAAVVAGRPLLHHAVGAVARVCAEVVVVVSRAAAEGGPTSALAGLEAAARDERSPRGRLRVVSDEEDHPGPLAAVLVGARAAAWPRVLVVGGDMPELQPSVLRRLLRWGTGSSGCVLVQEGGPRPLPVGLARDAILAVAPPLLANGERSLRALLGSLELERVAEATWRSLDPAARSLRDVDRPEDLATGPS